MDELIRYMRASVLLQVYLAQVLSERDGGAAFKPELLLADAGIPAKEIATMVGKLETLSKAPPAFFLIQLMLAALIAFRNRITWRIALGAACAIAASQSHDSPGAR